MHLPCFPADNVNIFHLKAKETMATHRASFNTIRPAPANWNDRGAMFSVLAQVYLFECDHTRMRRHREFAPSGSWDDFLNVVNMEAHNGATEGDLLNLLFGLGLEDVHDSEFWDYASFLCWEVIKPLYWIGFLNEGQTGSDGLLEREIYNKTRLWKMCLKLDSDKTLRPRVIH